MLLQRDEAQILQRIERGVIIGDLADESEIVAGQSVADEQREVGVVGQEAINLGINRIRRIARNALGIKIDQPPIAGACLEQKARSGAAARFHIDDRADHVAIIGLIEKRRRTEQPIFLAVGEERRRRDARSSRCVGLSARMVSRMVASPDASSAAPGPAGTES